MTRSLISLMLCVVVLLCSASHAAGLDGNRVAVNILYPDKGTVFESLGYSVISDLPSRFTDQSALLNVTSTQITLSYSDSWPYAGSGIDFNGYVLTNLDNYFPTPYLVAASTNFAGLTPDRYFVEGTRFYINLAGLVATSDSAIVFSLLPPVPEPESDAMFLAGTGLLGALVRRGRRRHNPARDCAIARPRH